MTASPSRRIALIVAAVAALATLVTLPGRAGAEPGDEGGTPTLGQVLDAAGRGYLEAKATLDASKRRQLELTENLRDVEARLDLLLVEVGQVAAVAYRTGRLTTAAALLNSASPDAFLERASAMELITQRDDAKVRELSRAREEQRRAKTAIDAEVATQAKQVAIMKKKRDDAERALVAVGGRATGGFVSAKSPLAKPAPRNPDGSWPTERCIIDDPTTPGCVTPRTLNALKQAQAAGFRRHTSCFRSGGPFEHPKGRACDYAAQRDGFGGTATGGDRRYGNDLAAFFVRNADRLGVLYVIWFRQIWFPGNGWRSYNGGSSPSGAHTNHVHLSLI
jgi:hypothetical protein